MNYLEHHGILGQKWGIRRYQNADGTLTAAGKERYKTDSGFREKIARYDAKKREDEKRKYINQMGPIKDLRKTQRDGKTVYINKRGQVYNASDRMAAINKRNAKIRKAMAVGSAGMTVIFTLAYDQVLTDGIIRKTALKIGKNAVNEVLKTSHKIGAKVNARKAIKAIDKNTLDLLKDVGMSIDDIAGLL